MMFNKDGENDEGVNVVLMFIKTKMMNIDIENIQ